LKEKKKDLLDFDPERFVKQNLEDLEEIKKTVLDPKKEKKLIEDFRKEIESTKNNILNLDIESEGKLYKNLLTFVYSIIKNIDPTEFYKEINAYYPIIRMFFLFFDPKKIVEILRNALEKTITITKKFDVEIVYDYSKKVIEYLRIFIGDDYADILLKYIKDDYDMLKKFSGEINIEEVSKEMNNQLTNFKNYILDHDAEYMVKEVKDTWNYILELMETYNPDFIVDSYKEFMNNLKEAYRKLDIELVVNVYQEVINLLKDFFNATKKNKFLSL
jgi:hypothetical protein